MKYTIIAALSALLCIGCSAEGSPKSSASVVTTNLSTELPELSGDYVWDMVEADSSVSFTAYYNGDFTGKFTRFQTAIKLNPDAPESGEIHAIVDLSSVAVKDDDVKSNLPKADWFNTKVHPFARFSATDISALGGDNYSAKGTLTLKGISQPAELNFSLVNEGNTATASGGLEISRKDFEVGSSADFQTEDWVKFPVSIDVSITAVKRRH